MSDQETESTAKILLRIESILVKIAIQLDCELAECEKVIAATRKYRSSMAGRQAVKTTEISQ